MIRTVGELRKAIRTMSDKCQLAIALPHGMTEENLMIDHITEYVSDGGVMVFLKTAKEMSKP